MKKPRTAKEAVDNYLAWMREWETPATNIGQHVLRDGTIKLIFDCDDKTWEATCFPDGNQTCAMEVTRGVHHE